MTYTIDNVLNLLSSYPDECEYIDSQQIYGIFDSLSSVIDSGINWRETEAPVEYWLELADALADYEADEYDSF